MKYYCCTLCEEYKDIESAEYLPCFKRVEGKTKEYNEQMGNGWEKLDSHCDDAVWKPISYSNMMLEMM